LHLKLERNRILRGHKGIIETNFYFPKLCRSLVKKTEPIKRKEKTKRGS
jgi:hypothetical protein